MRKMSLLFVCSFLCTLLHAQDPETPGSDHTPTVAIDGLLYKLSKSTLTAMVANGNNWEGELVIPEQVTYDDETYTVDRIEWIAFEGSKSLTKVTIPKTVKTIKHYAGWDDCKNPFVRCTSLKQIEVDEENPSMCSVEGVLFSKDKTQLYCYPAGAEQETYRIPEGVTWIGGDAFAYNPYLFSVQMPNSVTHMSFGTFSNCKKLSSVSISENVNFIAAYTFERCESLSLLDIPAGVEGFEESVFRWSPIKEIVIRGTFPRGLRDDTFYFMDDNVVAYVQKSEIEKFKEVFPGKVLSLETYSTSLMERGNGSVSKHPSYDLQGRRSDSSHGVYIRDGRKVVVK